MSSIVFPRNQINPDYLEVCKKYGFTCYRGTEKHWMFNTQDTKILSSPAHKAFRLLDAYFNLSGYNTYKISEIKDASGMVNVSSSKFFRPYNKTLSFMESMRISRVKKGMSYAAKHNEVYHIWWHPHNFGSNIDENFKNLEDIFKHYKNLNSQFNLKSETMRGVGQTARL